MIAFFKDLDSDIRKSLIEQLRNLWTHTSTAIEGNTLTLGETAFVLKEGLTVSGKSLKDHKEVVGHAKAIDILYNMLDKKNIEESDLFLLHKTIQTENIMDIYNPVGAWKVENNGTYHITKDNKQIFINYPKPEKIPELMESWLIMLNTYISKNIEKSNALEIYAKLHISFVSIHPFCDGNGRMVRLLANLPVLASEFPPIIISKTKRYDYIKLLSEYQQKAKNISKTNLITTDLSKFKEFIEIEWQSSIELIENAYKEQEKRK